VPQNSDLSPASGLNSPLATKRRILVADDHPLFRQALRAAITRRWQNFTVEETDTLDSTMAALRRLRDVEFVMLDLKMPDCSGFAGLLTLRATYPHLPVIIVSASASQDIIDGSINFGASGFIPKSATYSECLSAVLDGDVWAPNKISEKTVVQSSIAALTATELKVLTCLQRGLVNRQIAAQLNVSVATIKLHLSSMFRKLKVANRTQAVFAAQALNLPLESP
jgi:DNA-binding NarL/FixJ family response regulator